MKAGGFRSSSRMMMTLEKSVKRCVCVLVIILTRNIERVEYQRSLVPRKVSTNWPSSNPRVMFVRQEATSGLVAAPRLRIHEQPK